ncbi:AAA family ATPase, partial [Liquorilactobacillus capillatus]|uniref:AAA family ATPase n=1 Tax=Liquorilactobacillus capillatus TaxID=480931 RepID=UPI001F3A73E2
TSDMKKIIVVMGAPCSGKTTYVLRHLTSNDLLYDFDKLMYAFTNTRMSKNLISFVIQLRLDIINEFIRNNNYTRLFLITTKLTPMIRNQLRFLPYELVVMKTSKETCLKRLKEDTKRPNHERLEKVIINWFSDKNNLNKNG